MIRNFILFLALYPIHAGVITYYLHDARIGDSYAVGAFDFDTSTGVVSRPAADFSGIHFGGPAASALTPLIFFPVTGTASVLTGFSLVPATTPMIHIAFSPLLGGDAATFDLTDSYVKFRGQFGPPSDQFLYFNSGFASSTGPTSAPEPSTWLVTLTGLAMALAIKSSGR